MSKFRQQISHCTSLGPQQYTRLVSAGATKVQTECFQDRPFFIWTCNLCCSGDGRYSLLGQPLQYSLCPPPLMHGQSSYTSHQVRTGSHFNCANFTQSLHVKAVILTGLQIFLIKLLCICCHVLLKGLNMVEYVKMSAGIFYWPPSHHRFSWLCDWRYFCEVGDQS